MMPSLFVSHGAPNLPLTDAPARHYLASLAEQLPQRPKAILVVSAHWETDLPHVNAVAVNDTIHDFGGFETKLYSIRYPAPGSTALAVHVRDLLASAGLRCAVDQHRGLDHGAWMPLMLMYPQAEIPVVQLSVQTTDGPAHHIALGRALEPLRAEGVLIVGSGSFTHDLSEFRQYRHVVDAPEPAWVSSFADWFADTLDRADMSELADYRRRAPFAAKNHPTEEHLLPLFVAMGAAGSDPGSRRLHASTTHGVLRMDVYAFGGGNVRG